MASGTKSQQVQAETPRKVSTLIQEEEKAPTEPETSTQPETVAATAQPVKVEPPAPQVTETNCAQEVVKYSWNHTVAYNVMMAESKNNPDNHNDDSSTGDYSIGCFQINLLGNANLRAKYRDAVKVGYTGDMSVAGLETWLKVAKNNVAVAHIMWQSSSWAPWGATTCKYKVSCY